MIDIPYEAVCKITTEELKASLQNLEVDYESRKNGGITAGVFSSTLEVDLKKIKKMIRAVERVLKFYGVNLDA